MLIYPDKTRGTNKLVISLTTIALFSVASPTNDQSRDRYVFCFTTSHSVTHQSIAIRVSLHIRPSVCTSVGATVCVCVCHSVIYACEVVLSATHSSASQAESYCHAFVISLLVSTPSARFSYVFASANGNVITLVGPNHNNNNNNVLVR